jgi:hypothetical protein
MTTYELVSKVACRNLNLLNDLPLGQTCLFRPLGTWYQVESFNIPLCIFPGLTANTSFSDVFVFAKDTTRWST